MTAETLAAALLRDVPRTNFYPFRNSFNEMVVKEDTGEWLFRNDVLAALSRAMSDDLAERAGGVLTDLQKGPEFVYRFVTSDHAAADLIIALIAQNAALRAERDAAKQIALVSITHGQDVEARAERLEAALQWQAEQPEAHPFMVVHALAALKGADHE